MSTEEKIEQVLDALQTTLQEKNKRYGDAAINPARIFSVTGAESSIRIRIDDKLARIRKSDGMLRKNDVFDLMGYLVLLSIANGWESFDEQVD